tara:strand:+ start:954 stop:1445 length:492 start_codon:yes stop_codon:yes gene_type:complete
MAKTPPGRHQCPFCKDFFNIATKEKSAKIIDRTERGNQIQNIKVAFLSSFGVVFVIFGIYVFFFESFPIFGLVPFFCGLYLLIPLMFYKQDKQNRELEIQLNASGDFDKRIRVKNTSKSIVKGLLGTAAWISIIIAIIAIIMIVMMLTMLIGLFSSGGGSAFG